MVQHMVLAMITPILLLVAAPVTLALRTLPRGQGAAAAPRALLLNFLHSRFTRFLASPGFTVPLFIASLYSIYFTPVFDALMSNPAGHQFMLAHFVVTGLLFFGPIIAQDPWPNTHSHPTRILELVILVPFHAFFGVAVMTSRTVIAGEFYRYIDAPWAGSLLADQQVGGGIAWGAGEIPLVIVIVALVTQWARQDSRVATRVDRHLDQGTDDSWEAYNAMLAKLDARGQAPVPEGARQQD
jgi:cytochrome c oxidase assembly factor CtaG